MKTREKERERGNVEMERNDELNTNTINKDRAKEQAKQIVEV